MAIDLGAITFAINANSTSLMAATTRIRQFQATMNAAAQSIAASAAQMSNAVNASANSVNNNVNHLNRNMGAFTGGIHALGQASILLNGPLGGVATRMNVLANAFSRGQIGMLAVVGGAAAAGYAFFKLGQQAVNAQRQMQGIVRAFDATHDSSLQSARDFTFVQDVANRAGQKFMSLASQFTQLSAASAGTSLEGEKTRHIFEAITFAASKLSLSSEDVDGSLRAIQQMMSKGTVQAEELRGQLGDRLPGAFRIAAQAMGVTTAELGNMLKKGQVLSADFLPKFADALIRAFDIDTAGKIDGIVQSENRLANAITTTSLELDKAIGFSSAYATAIDLITKSIQGWGFAAQFAAPYIQALSDIKPPTWAASLAIFAATGVWPKVDPTTGSGLGVSGTKGSAGSVNAGPLQDLTMGQRFNEIFAQPVVPGQRRGNDLTGITNTTGKETDFGDDSRHFGTSLTQHIDRAGIGIGKITREIDNLNAEADLYAKGGGHASVKALSDFKGELEITDAVSAYGDKLKGLGISTKQVTDLTNQYEKALRRVKTAEKVDANTISSMEFMEKIIGDGLVTATDNFTQALMNGQSVMDSLKDTARTVVAEMLNQFIKLAFIAPLMNSLFGQNNPTLGGGGGGIFSALFGGAAAAGVGAVATGMGGTGIGIAATMSARRGGLSGRRMPHIYSGGVPMQGSGGGGIVAMHVDVSGAQGDKQITNLVHKAAAAGVMAASHGQADRVVSIIKQGQARGRL